MEDSSNTNSHNGYLKRMKYLISWHLGLDSLKEEPWVQIIYLSDKPKKQD